MTMYKFSGNRSRRGLWPLRWAPLLAGLLTLTLAGCDLDDLLTVDDPDRATPGAIREPTALPAVHASAIGDFAFAFTGSAQGQNDGQVLYGGLLGDEFLASGSFPTREEVDRREILVDNTTLQDLFERTMRARVAAERGIEIFGESEEAGDARHAELFNLAGYSAIIIGEHYCSGVPFSDVDAAGNLEFGEPLTTQQIFERALGQLQEGLATAEAAGSAQQQNLARVGIARTLLNLGRFQEAAAVASEVEDTDFEYELFHSANSTRQANGVWNFVNNVRRWSIPNRFGGNGLPYREDGVRTDAPSEDFPQPGGGDPRVSYFQDGQGFDANVVQWSQNKYPTRTSSIVLADGVEARLIEAEAALRGGNEAEFLAIHTALREEVFGDDAEDLTPLTARDGEDGLVDVHFRERAYWMWMTGHRLGDLRRLIRQYEQAAATVFPTGSYFKGGAFGSDTNLPVPFDERNNPNFEQCLERDDSMIETS